LYVPKSRKRGARSKPTVDIFTYRTDIADVFDGWRLRILPITSYIIFTIAVAVSGVQREYGTMTSNKNVQNTSTQTDRTESVEERQRQHRHWKTICTVQLAPTVRTTSFIHSYSHIQARHNSCQLITPICAYFSGYLHSETLLSYTVLLETKHLNKTELQHAYAALTETDHDVTNLKFVFLSTTYIDNCHELVRFLYVIAKLCMYISCLNMVNNCSFGCYMKRMNHIRAIIVWYEQFWVQWDVEYF